MEAQAARYSAWRSRAMTCVAGTGVRPRARADLRLDLGVDVRIGPDGPRQFADGHGGSGRPHAPAVAIGLQGPQRELGPEGRGLGVHAVGASGHRDVEQLEGAGLEGGHERVEVRQQQVGGAGERGAERRVHHVGGCEPVVDQGAGGGTDAVLHHIDEGGDVVVGDLLAFEHVRDEDVVHRGSLDPARHGVLGRHHAEGGQGLGGQELDLEPEREPRRVAEQRRHVRRCVARDHQRAPSGAATVSPATRAAMSRRICMPSQSIGAAAA